MRKFYSGFLLLLTLLFFSTGCGLDTFIYLYPVTQLLNNPLAGSTDNLYNYYKFRTTDADNTANSADYFKGFTIYYRIYNSTAVQSQDASDISTGNTNNPATILNYIVNVKKYTRMTSSLRIGAYPLIPAAAANRDVTIRLIDYGTTDPADFLVDSASYGIPLRTKNDGTATDSFVFSEIVSSDVDVMYASTGETDKWYVQSYVLAYGYDGSYKPIYSSLFSLGVITIFQ